MKKWTPFVIEQVALNKSSLLLKIEKQNTQTLQLFTKKSKIFTKIIKMASWEAWVKRPSGLIKSGGKHKCFLRLIKVDNVS